MKISRRYYPLALLAGVAAVIGCSEQGPTAPPPEPNAGRDITAPQQVVDPVLSHPGPGGSAVLTWQAPRDDAEHDRVDRYEIRFSYSFPLNWEISARVPDPPAPGLPGESQECALPNPSRGRDLYAAIRSIDAAGNASPISNIAHVHIDGFDLVGYCLEAVSRTPIEGAEVLVTAGRVHQLVTDHEGGFVLDDLTAGVVNISLRAGSPGQVFHHYDRAFELANDTSMDCLMIEYEETELPVGVNVLTLFAVAADLSPTSPTFKKWRSYPIKCYIPPFENNGLDFGETTRQAAINWSTKSGVQVFTFVDSPPDTGVTVSFKPRSQMGGQIGITRHTDDPDGFPLKSEVDMIDEITGQDKLWQIALHELGHTIRLGHLPEGYIMHHTQPLPLDITNDEAKVARLYIALPIGTNITAYDISDPR